MTNTNPSWWEKREAVLFGLVLVGVLVWVCYRVVEPTPGTVHFETAINLARKLLGMVILATTGKDVSQLMRKTGDLTPTRALMGTITGVAPGVALLIW